MEQKIFFKDTPNPFSKLFMIEKVKFSNFPCHFEIRGCDEPFIKIFDFKIFKSITIHEDFFSVFIHDHSQWEIGLSYIYKALEKFVKSDIIEIKTKQSKGLELEIISKIISENILPIIAKHGGTLEVLSIFDKTLCLRLSGSCFGCEFNNKSFKEKIEKSIKILLIDKNLKEIVWVE